MRHIAGAAGPPDEAYDADVVILALDRAEETSAAIRSALAQSGVSRHVFVVDQGSQPDNLARIAAVVAEHTGATLVALEHNYGVAGGRNRGAALGHGRVIFGLDNDAEFADATALAHAVAALDGEPALAAIGCRILVHGGDTDDMSSWGYPARLLPSAAGTFDAITFVGAAHAIRRTAWHACGGYDDALFFCWEEFDFCLRAIAAGWRIRYRGDIAVYHKISSEQRFIWSGRRWFHYVRNRLYIARKWGASWPALGLRVAGYLLKGAHNGLLRQTLRAVLAARGMSHGLMQRRLPPAAQAYLRANDTAYRGSPLFRLWHEALSLLPQTAGRPTQPNAVQHDPAAPRPSRSRSSSGMIAGQSHR